MIFSIEKMASIALVVACVIVSGEAAFKTYRSLVPPQPVPIYRAGDIIKDMPILDFKDSAQTVLVVTASTCHFCTESMPFYKRLVEISEQSNNRIVALSAEDPHVNRAYLASYGVSVQNALSLKDTNVKIRATPTLIVVQSDGRVVNTWQGKLDMKSEQEVIRAISRY